MAQGIPHQHLTLIQTYAWVKHARYLNLFEPACDLSAFGKPGTSSLSVVIFDVITARPLDVEGGRSDFRVSEVDVGTNNPLSVVCDGAAALVMLVAAFDTVFVGMVCVGVSFSVTGV